MFSDFISTCKGETAIGSGSRFPLVISTSINAIDLLIKNNITKKIKKKFFHFNLLTFLLD